MHFVVVIYDYCETKTIGYGATLDAAERHAVDNHNLDHPDEKVNDFVGLLQWYKDQDVVLANMTDPSMFMIIAASEYSDSIELGRGETIVEAEQKAIDNHNIELRKIADPDWSEVSDIDGILEYYSKQTTMVGLMKAE